MPGASARGVSAATADKAAANAAAPHADAFLLAGFEREDSFMNVVYARM